MGTSDQPQGTPPTPQGAEAWEAPPEPDAATVEANDALLDAPAAPEPATTATPAPAKADTDTAAAPAPAEAPAEEAEEVVAAPEWKSIEDVQAALASEDFPAEARPYLEAAMEQIRPYAAGLESAKLGFEQSASTLQELAKKMEAAGAEGAQELADNYTGILQTVDAMSDDMVKTSWELLEFKHPELAKIPADHPLQVAFKKMLTAEEHFKLFADEPRYVSKLERAFELCAFRTKTDLTQFAPAVAAPAPTAPQKSAAAAGKRPMPATTTAKAEPPPAPKKRTGGSIVADGSIAPTAPRRNIDDMTVDELMAQHEDLLGPN